MQEPNTQEVVPKVEFNVKNRHRAEKVAKILYGPNARTWINRGDGVQVGTEKNGNKDYLATGISFTEALREAVKSFLADDATAWSRAKKLLPYADVTEFLVGRAIQ